jgi:hypothetical protein
MVACGFAPSYRKWWHFSYGDREWAAFYNTPSGSLYGPVDIRLLPDGTHRHIWRSDS